MVGHGGADELELVGRSGGRPHGAATPRLGAGPPHLEDRRPPHLLLLAAHYSFLSSANGHSAPAAEASMVEATARAQLEMCAKTNCGYERGLHSPTLSERS